MSAPVLGEKGRTGFAHLFEHMMFEGSANVKKGEHMRFVESNGGTLNGSTHPDYTNYFEVPAIEQVGTWSLARVRPHAQPGHYAREPC